MKCLRYIVLLTAALLSLAAEAAQVSAAEAARAPAAVADTSLAVKGATMLDSLLLRFNTYSAWCAPEKVYLHFDRTCYTAGETIWFKGWLKEASQKSVLPPSNYMYAEVLDDKGEALLRVKVKRSGDGFPGCIDLPEDLVSGYYTIRAYTLWQLNYPEEYLFNDRIRIIGAEKEKKGKQGPTPEEMEISFWPEGGRYYADHGATIGFKAVDGLGRSVDFQGVLVNDAGKEQAQVASTHDGMGAFSFVPKAGRSYSVRDAAGRLHPLPVPSKDGATIQVQTHSDKYYVSTLGFGGGEASLLVRDAAELYPLANVSLDGKRNIMMLERTFFRPGINHFLLVDSRGKILSERLIFIRDGEAPDCFLEMEQFKADRRSLVKGVISLTGPDGAPLDGHCSVSVVRGVLKNWQQSDGITSYMGLSSELKGRVNNPYYYFDPEIPLEERDAALDLLMMIQGWRYYDLDQITDLSGGNIRLRHMRERMQEIRVHVDRLLSSKMPKKFTFTVLVPRRNVMESIDIEEGKHFIVDSLDFPENTEVIINIGTSRIGAHYIPKWDGDIAAKPFPYKPAPGFTKNVQMDEPPLDGPASDDTLQAAMVTASYAEDDVLIFGRSFREDLETYKEMTLVEYLSMRKAMFEYDGENMYNRSRRRSLTSDSEDSTDFGEDDENDSGKVKLIVDETEEEWWAFDMLRLEDLRTLSVSTHPDPVYGGDGGVVHITIKPGAMNQNLSRNPSILYFVPLGYQLPRYFEAPRYDQGEDMPYDQRNTLWWDPDVELAGGRAPLDFFNNDLSDYPYVVRIEGLTSDGHPFSRHCLIAPQ
ncbi:MAG: hypothetical protein IKP46_07425 [Bacteroidales bacterium]|nr:hypothetical protein [Bacteroidales bacterium]